MSCSSLVLIKLLLLALAFLSVLDLYIQVECLDFSYLSFPHGIDQDFILSPNASIGVKAIEVTYDAQGASISNLAGRVCYHRQFKLWSKHKTLTASFKSTFVLNIKPRTSPTGGEGMAFLLAADCSIPDNSQGQWLGIVNATTNGSTSTQSNVIAVEFDTNKSYPEDIDGNHVGVDVNSISSILQVPLTSHSVNLSSGEDIIASIQYDGVSKVLEIFVNATGSESMMKKKDISPIISMPLDLSKHLPESVFVGFSASTGESTELNCLKSWNFTSTDIDDADPNFLLWVRISIPAMVIVFSIGVITCIYRKRKRREEEEKDAEIEQEIQNSASGHPQKLKLKELKLATHNFSSKNELGEGGFGRVYKGFLNNKEVAVKRLASKNWGHGKQEFIAEVTTIGSLHHKNLVKLLGWCYESNELILVYEFMPKGSLDKLIFGNERPPPPPLLEIEKDSNSTILSWRRRHGIICGVAEALDYLHNGCEKRVLHRDIKASNIMLDSEFNPRLGDFGLARTFHLSEKTHHSTKEIAGTLGYMAPEIFHTGRASVETDVYAFGVLLLEVSCGRKPGKQDEHNNYINRIVEWVWELHRRKKISKAIDFRLYGDLEEEEAECVLLLGLACCHPNPYHRPSMKTVLQVLIGEIAPPLVPLERPPFMWPAAAAISPSFEDHLDYSLSGLSDIIIGR